MSEESQVYKATVVVTLRKSILDPQGKAVEHALHSLGADRISDIRMGKRIEFILQVDKKEEAEIMTIDACKKLLANPVMEDFSYELEKV